MLVKPTLVPEMTFPARSPVFPLQPEWYQAAVDFQGRNLPAERVLVASRARSSAAKGVVRKVEIPAVTGVGMEVVMTAAKATAREEEMGVATTAVSSAASTVAKRWQLASFSVEIGLGPAAQPLQLPRRGRPSL